MSQALGKCDFQAAHFFAIIIDQRYKDLIAQSMPRMPP